MKETALTARRLLEQTGEHPVISVYFDLNPEEFATAPARAIQARSLLDQAARTAKSDGSLGHRDRVSIEQDLERIGSFLQSRELPVSGARAVAVFCSGQHQLFEALRLTDPVAPRVVIARTPYIEPLVVGHDPGRWCVALVNRRVARIFDGSVHELHEARDLDDNVHGQHQKGGWSQPNYERSYETEADSHLRSVATELYREWQRTPFQTLVLGGPTE